MSEQRYSQSAVSDVDRDSVAVSTTDRCPTTASPGALSTQAGIVRGPTILEVIQQIARDPQADVAKFEALVSLLERQEAREAERAFNRDFIAAKLEMPRITKDGKIEMGSKGTIAFAEYENIDAAIRPIEAKYGFARSFSTLPSEQPGILMILTLKHVAGHSETSTRHMPPDKGPGRNAMQEVGSASSYAKRYLTLDKWDIVTTKQDNDANSIGFLDERQVSNIIDLMNACEMDPASQSKFLKFAEAETVSEIQKRNYAKCMTALQAKLRKSQEAHL